MKKKIKEMVQKTEFKYFNSLTDLLNDIKFNGYTEKDYNNLEFELNYDACWYESDPPSITVVYNKPL